METSIKLETQGRSPVEIKELNLDNCPSTQITGLTDEYCNLESLSLINVGLTTLEGFPKLPNLKKLELSDNCISGDLNWLHGSPKLAHLNLSGNKIKDIKALMPLGELKNLEDLDLFGCEVSLIQNYRDEIFGFISSLKHLDGYDRNNKEAGDSEAEIDEENAASTARFTFSNTTNSKPSVGATEKPDIAILQKQFWDILLSGDDHDVTIKIKNREYKAHKNVLRVRSPVFFSAMFKHQMKENVDNSVSVEDFDSEDSSSVEYFDAEDSVSVEDFDAEDSVSVEDFDAEDFSKFLQYIYTGEVENLSLSSALNLYYAGDKYQISGLKEACVNFLKSTLSTASICDVVTLATKHNEADLLQCAISFFSEHLEEILFSADWQRFLTENPIKASEFYKEAMETSYKKIS